jgi:mannose-1-phosphate guanylyltransferase
VIIPSPTISIGKFRNVSDCSVLVLAGGDGARLRALTTTSTGEVIPKQYCSLGGEPCLLQQAVARAKAVAGEESVWPVVASDHERWWHKALANVSRSHIIVQPQNKGTAFGILLGLLTLERSTAAGTVLILPADHYVADEKVLLKALRRLTQWSQRDPEGIFLLGAQPEEADPALGYILPWFDARFTPIGVYEFIERPKQLEAQKLINRGALWNTFIVAGSRQALLRAYEPRFASQIETLRQILDRPPGDPMNLQGEYRRLGSVDFSHDILEQHADHVKVLRLPVCGWTELGTVSKIKKALSHMDGTASSDPLFLDLAESSKNLESRLNH